MTKLPTCDYNLNPIQGKCVLCLQFLSDSDQCKEHFNDKCNEQKRTKRTKRCGTRETIILCDCGLEVGPRQEFTLYHSTDAAAAKAIKKSKTLLPGKGGILGSAIYLADTARGAIAKGGESAGRSGTSINQMVTVHVTATPVILSSFDDRPQEVQEIEKTGDSKKVAQWWKDLLEKEGANMLELRDSSSVYHWEHAKGAEFVIYDADDVGLKVTKVEPYAQEASTLTKNKKKRSKALEEYLDYNDYVYISDIDSQSSDIGYNPLYLSGYESNDSEYIVSALMIVVACVMCALCLLVVCGIGCVIGYMFAKRNKRKEDYENIA